MPSQCMKVALIDVRITCVAEHGKKNDYTIRAGKILAMTLQDQNRGGEARELLAKILATSKQVYGAHHNTTKEIELELFQFYPKPIAEMRQGNF